MELRGDVSHGRGWRSQRALPEKLLLPLCLLAAVGVWRGTDADGGGRKYGVHAPARNNQRARTLPAHLDVSHITFNDSSRPVRKRVRVSACIKGSQVTGLNWG